MCVLRSQWWICLQLQDTTIVVKAVGYIFSRYQMWNRITQRSTRGFWKVLFNFLVKIISAETFCEAIEIFYWYTRQEMYLFNFICFRFWISLRLFLHNILKKNTSLVFIYYLISFITLFLFFYLLFKHAFFKWRSFNQQKDQTPVQNKNEIKQWKKIFLL